MYRDDRCAVCGEALPPDHFYCREHGAQVDERLHEIGALVPRLTTDAARLAELFSGVAAETWDYLAEEAGDDVPWPPAPALAVRAEPEQVTVDVDTEPGLVRVDVRVPPDRLLAGVAAALQGDAIRRMAEACAAAEGADATH